MPTLFSTLPSSLHIGVIRGGPGSEYENSILSGGEVLNHLRETHKPIDIFISKDGKWHVQGIERPPERILKNVDVVWNALHGEYGENGQIQEILNRHGVPYTGSLRYQSAIAMNKIATKDRVKAMGIKTPLYSVIRPSERIDKKAKEIIHSIPYPLVVKPVSGSGKSRVSVVKTSAELLSAIESVLSTGNSALIEECISGKDASCGVINNFRGDSFYTLPPVQTSSDGETHSCPGNFSESEKREIERIATEVHSKLGLGHYSKSDFVISPRRGIYFLEINTLPKLDKKSSLGKSLEAVGISTKEFIHHLISLALRK